MPLNTKGTFIPFFAHFHSFLFFSRCFLFPFLFYSFFVLHTSHAIYLFMVAKQRGRLIRLFRVIFLPVGLDAILQLEFIKSLNLQIFLCALSMLCTNSNDAFELGMLHETKRFLYHFPFYSFYFGLDSFSFSFSTIYHIYNNIVLCTLPTNSRTLFFFILIAFYLFSS